MNEGATTTVTLTATDADGDPLTFSLSGNPAFVTLAGAVVTIAPDFTHAGNHAATVAVSDGKESVNGTLDITVANVNRPPALTAISDVTMTAGTSQTVALVASDPDGDTVTFSATNLPSWGSLAGATLTFNPGASVVDNLAINVTASDGTLTDAKTFNVTVNPPGNLPPVLSGLAQVDSAGTAIVAGATVVQTPRFRGTVSDPESAQVKIEVEVVTSATAFTDTATTSGTLSAAGTLELVLGSLTAGTYKWQMRALDAQGLGSAWTAFNSGNAAFTIQAGAIAGSLSINAAAQATRLTSVTLAIAATPSTGGAMTDMRFSNDGATYGTWEAFAATRAAWALATGDGTKTVYVEVRDSNAVTAVFSDTILLDTANPAISAFTINSNAVGTSNTAVTLTYAATDPSPGSGIATTEASNDGTTFSAIGTSPAAFALTGADGSKTVTLRVTDAAGNQATSTDTIFLDTVDPTITSATLNAGSAYTSTLTNSLVVVADDGAAGSGPAEICVSGGATAQCQPFGTGTVTITLTSGDGAKTVLVTVKDGAGRSSLPSVVNVTLDTVVPTLTSITLNGGAALTNSPVLSVASVATDASSGVAQIAFRDGATFGAWLPYVNPISFTLAAGEGDRTLSAKVRDGAGNESAIVAAMIRLDTVAPTGTVSINAGAAATNNVAVTLTFTPADATSTVTHRCAKEVNTPPASAADACWLTLATTAFTFTGADSATKTVYVWFKDSANNYGTVATTDAINLDRVAPTLTIAGAGLGLAAGATYTNLTTIAFNNTATDASSGLNQVCTGAASPPTICVAYTATPSVSLNTPDGVRTRYIRVSDLAGNTSAILSDSITLDQTAPTVSAVVINGGAAYTNTLTVNITSTAADATSTVAQMQFSTNAGSTWNAAIPYVTPATFGLPAGDGNKIVDVRVIDGAGNVSTGVPPNDAIFLDQTSPTATLTATAGRYTNVSPTPVNISSVEGGSGVYRMCVKVAAVAAPAPPAPSSAADACFVTFATPANVVINGGGNGDKRVYVWLLDNAGNFAPASPATVDIWYDATLPTVPTAPGVLAGHRNLRVSWTASTDASSGVAGYEVGLATVSGGPYAFEPLVTASPSDVVSPNRILKYLVVRSVDRAGNRSANSAQISATPRYPFNLYQRVPTAVDLNGIAVSGTRYLMAGMDGALFTSDDSLATYDRRDPMTDGHLRAVRNSGGLWVVGDDGFIANGIGSGDEWNVIANSQPAQSHLYDVTFAGGGGFSSYFTAVGANGTILRGTRIFLADPSFAPVTSPTAQTLRGVAYCNAGASCSGANVVVAVGDNGAIVRSVDSGATWATVTPPTGYATADFKAVLHMPGTSTMYAAVTRPAAGYSTVLVSANGGATWSQVLSPAMNDFDATSLAAFDGTTFWVGGGAPRYLVKVSAGVRTNQTVLATQRPVSGLAARSATEIASVAETEVERTTTGGPAWTSASSGVTSLILDVSIPPTFTSWIWAVGTGGYIASSLSSGITWTQAASPTGTTLNSIATVDLTGSPLGVLALAVGNGGVIVRKPSGVATWALDPDSGITTNTLNSVRCRNASSCLAVGANQTVLVYASGNWTVQTTGAGTETYLGSDHYLAGGVTPRSIVVGTNGALRTLNNITWTNQAPIAARTFYRVQAKRDFAGTALAVGTLGAIYKSTNHGVNWTVRTSGTTATLRDVENVPGTSTWFAAGYGVLLKSTDDGESWFPLTSNATSELLYSVTCTGTSASRVWISGSNGLVGLSTTAGE